MTRFAATLLSALLLPLAGCTESSTAGPAAALEQGTVTGGDVTPQAFSKALTERPGAILLDVRTAREWNEGHLAGARRWDYFDTAFRDSLALSARNSLASSLTLMRSTGSWMCSIQSFGSAFVLLALGSDASLQDWISCR